MSLSSGRRTGYVTFAVKQRPNRRYVLTRINGMHARQHNNIAVLQATT